MSTETTENVVTTEVVAPKKQPKSFNDLKHDELVAAAQVFGTDDQGTNAAMIADLTEAGVTWKMYVKQFKLDGHEAIPDAEELAFAQVDEENLIDADEEGVNEVSEVITAAPTPTLEAAEKYLIKFVGQNPYFEFGKYKFTQEKPYGIMPSADAQRALVQEPTKFRQAFPAELQEFY